MLLNATVTENIRTDKSTASTEATLKIRISGGDKDVQSLINDIYAVVDRYFPSDEPTPIEPDAPTDEPEAPVLGDEGDAMTTRKVMGSSTIG